MILSRTQLFDTLRAANVPNLALLVSAQTMQGQQFATVDRRWVEDVWRNAIEALPLNMVEKRKLQAGTSIVVPRYILNGFNCRGHSLYVYSQGMMGFAAKAAASALPLEHDALAFGLMGYIAEPRADNLGRAGGHMQLWFVDNTGAFQTFEGGDGEENEMTDTELASVMMLICG